VGSGIRSLSLNEERMGSCNTNDTLLERNVPSEQRHLNTSIIFNRVWAALKRESLVIVDEGVGDPKGVDTLFMVPLGID